MAKELDPFARMHRRLQLNEYERLEDRVEGHGETLRDVHEALLMLRDEIGRLRRGEPPAGTVARY